MAEHVPGMCPALPTLLPLSLRIHFIVLGAALLFTQPAIGQDFYLDGNGIILSNSGNQFFQNSINPNTWTEITYDLGVVPAGAELTCSCTKGPCFLAVGG